MPTVRQFTLELMENKMKKLYMFGDSYVAPNRTSTEWGRLLANKIGGEYENFGVDGSSSEHAMRKFQELTSKTTISYSIIIVLLSTVGRLDLMFQLDRPETASVYLHTDMVSTDPRHEWYRENKKYIEWLIVNYNYRSAWLNRECYIHALKNFAESDPSNLVIVLQNSLQSSDTSSFISRGKVPDNFIISETDVNNISRDEIIDSIPYHNFVKHTRWDPRVNHLTNPNLEIMAESLHQVIVTRDATRLSYDNFQKNIIPQVKTQRELDEYIAAGILHPNIIMEIK